MDKLSELQDQKSFRSRLISGSIWAVTGKSLSAFGSFLTFLLISGTLSTEDTSVFVYCESTAIIGTIFATAGLHTVIVRVLRSWKIGHRHYSLPTFGFRIVGIYLAVYCIVAIVSAVICSQAEAAMLVRVRQNPGTVLSWILLLGANQIVSEFLRGFENFRDAATMGGQNPGVLTLVISLSILTLCCMAGVLNLPLVFAIQLLAMTVTLIWGLVRLKQTSASQNVRTRAVSTAPHHLSCREILAEGIPNLITQISTLGVAHLEILMLGQICDGTGVATYSGMKRLVQITSAPLLMVNSALPTFIADLVSQGKLARLETILRGSATLCFIPLLFVTSVFLLIPQTTISCIFPAEYSTGAATLQFLSLGNIASVASGSCGLLLVMTGSQRFAMLSGIIAAIVFLATAPVLTVTFGITGMAAAVAVSTGIRNTLSVLFARWCLGIWTLPRLSPAILRQAIQMIRVNQKM